MTELGIILDHLNNACCPEEVFGEHDDIAVTFRKLARACHPDLHPGDPHAEAAFQKLNSLKDVAEKRRKDGTWGKRVPLPHCVPMELCGYKVSRTPIVGDIADLYAVEGKSILVKVGRSYDDNDLLRAEAKALEAFSGHKGPARDGVPRLLKTFQIDGVRKREVNVIEQFPGFFTALEVSQKVKVDERTAVWMFKRLMTVLSWLHHFGFVHGAILPPHVMFYPDNDGHKFEDLRKHSVRLIDWCYSVEYKKRTRLSAWLPAWKDLYAPELIAKKELGPASDIFMAASLMKFLSGPLPTKMQKVLNRCLEPDPSKRYQKAGQAFDDWKKAAAEEFGAPKWHDFNL